MYKNQSIEVENITNSMNWEKNLKHCQQPSTILEVNWAGNNQSNILNFCIFLISIWQEFFLKKPQSYHQVIKICEHKIKINKIKH